MTTIVQALLLATTILLVLYFLTNRRKARAKAGVKLGFVLLVLLAIWAVLRPDDVTVVAQAVGVARGTDFNALCAHHGIWVYHIVNVDSIPGTRTTIRTASPGDSTAKCGTAGRRVSHIGGQAIKLMPVLADLRSMHGTKTLAAHPSEGGAPCHYIRHHRGWYFCDRILCGVL